MSDELNEETEKTEYTVNEKLLSGISLYNEKHYEKALQEFLLLNSDDFSDDDKTEHAYYLGLCYTKIKQYDEALLYLEQVVTAGNNVYRVIQCRLALAYIYVITKRTKLAVFELKKLRAGGFESPMLFNTLAYAAWSQKQNRNAIELYEKALEIDINNATAMNSMGFILADTGIDIVRGLRLCKKAVDSRPNNAAYLDSLGWAYYKSGEPVEARTWLRRALEIAPNEHEINRHFKIVTGEKA